MRLGYYIYRSEGSLPSIDLNRLRRSAANSGVGLSSADPTFKKFARCASKFGSIDMGSLIFSANDESLNLLYDVVVKEFDKATISAKTRRRAQYFIMLNVSVCIVLLGIFSEMFIVVIAVQQVLSAACCADGSRAESRAEGGWSFFEGSVQFQDPIHIGSDPDRIYQIMDGPLNGLIDSIKRNSIFVQFLGFYFLSSN